MMDDVSRAACRRSAKLSGEHISTMRREGADVSEVIAINMLAQFATLLTQILDDKVTEAFLNDAQSLYERHYSMTDEEWARFDDAILEWAELGVKHFGKRMEDGDARDVAAIARDIFGHARTTGHGWIPVTMDQVRSLLR